MDLTNPAFDGREKLQNFCPGDVIRVHSKVKDGKEVRKQRFEGMVISCKGKGLQQTFTVRKVVDGCGVERIFPLYSPSIEKVERLSHTKVRRAKLTYLRKSK